MPNYVDQSYNQGNFYDAVTGQKIGDSVFVAALNGTYLELKPLYSVYPTTASTSANDYFMFGCTVTFGANGTDQSFGVIPPSENTNIDGNRIFLYGGVSSLTLGGRGSLSAQTSANLVVDGSAGNATIGAGNPVGAMLTSHPTGYFSVFPYFKNFGKGSSIKTADSTLLLRCYGGENNAPSASTTLAMVLNTPRIVPVFTSGRGNLVIQFEVTTAGAASNVMRVGVYVPVNSPWTRPTTVTDGSYPAFLRSQTAVTTPTTSIGSKSVSFTQGNNYGWVYILIVSQVGTACTIRGVGAKTYNGVIPRIGTISSATDYNCFTCAAISGALPATLTTCVPTTGAPAIGIIST